MERIPFRGKLGKGPGCFTQIELAAALAIVCPAFVDPRVVGIVRMVAVVLALLASVGCFWAIVQFNWHVLRRLFYDASGNPIQRPERASAWMGGFAMFSLALLAAPCCAVGSLIVEGVRWSFRR